MYENNLIKIFKEFLISYPAKEFFDLVKKEKHRRSLITYDYYHDLMYEGDVDSSVSESDSDLDYDRIKNILISIQEN